ncbi:uncharacterized protein tmem244 [Xenopus tropicalis]|uniref:Uncharacterized protein tmem244 n=1 Tax=Xenopus tropicalis TaxID=8364 RepID=A0A8J1J4G4_XENTR|nr:uncharacterized protein tmem244 [Xenopus tropicalis]
MAASISVNILLCLLIFYSLFYMVCSVCTGAMRIETFDWKIPFDHKRQPSLSNVYYLGKYRSNLKAKVLKGTFCVKNKIVPMNCTHLNI